MTESPIALQGLIIGLVQGVFFRAETQRKAQQLGVNGWVRNTSDGHVELCLCGARDAVGDMVEWLHRGPPRARVDRVELQAVPCPDLSDFQILS